MLELRTCAGSTCTASSRMAEGSQAILVHEGPWTITLGGVFCGIAEHVGSRGTAEAGLAQTVSCSSTATPLLLVGTAEPRPQGSGERHASSTGVQSDGSADVRFWIRQLDSPARLRARGLHGERDTGTGRDHDGE